MSYRTLVRSVLITISVQRGSGTVVTADWPSVCQAFANPRVWGSSLEGFQQYNQIRKKWFFDFPNYWMVNAKIVMHYPVSKSTNPVPLNIWIFSFKIIRQSICSFSDYFKVANYSINSFAVVNEFFKWKSMVYSRILLALSIMSSTRRVGSRLDINDFRFDLMKIFWFHPIFRH